MLPVTVAVGGDKLGSVATKEGYDSRLARRNHAVISGLPQVKQIARTIHARLSGRVPIEDLVSTGVIGLIEAVSKFDARREIELRSYAHHRIRGAILDSLRGEDWASRDLRRRGRQLEKARDGLRRKLCREPSLAEVASAMGISEATAQTLVQDLHGLHITSLQDREPKTGVPIEETLVDASGNGPFEQYERKEMRDLLVRAISALPKRMRQLMDLYYFRGMSMVEVGQEMGVSESRVSQIHSQAIRTVRTIMNGLLDSRDGSCWDCAGTARGTRAHLRRSSQRSSNQRHPRSAAQGGSDPADKIPHPPDSGPDVS
jgi:RNA polymerase sigma factor for flagellar operon FliA